MITFIGSPGDLVKLIKSGNIYYKQCMMCLKMGDVKSAVLEAGKCLRLKKAVPFEDDETMDYAHPVYYNPTIAECFDFVRNIDIKYNFGMVELIQEHESEYKESP